MEKQQKIRRMKKKTKTCEFIFTPTKNSVEKFGHNFIKLRINWFARYNFFFTRQIRRRNQFTSVLVM